MRSGSLNTPNGGTHSPGSAAAAPRFDGPRSPPSTLCPTANPPQCWRRPPAATCSRLADHDSQTQATSRASSSARAPARPAAPVPSVTISAAPPIPSANTLQRWASPSFPPNLHARETLTRLAATGKLQVRSQVRQHPCSSGRPSHQLRQKWCHNRPCPNQSCRPLSTSLDVTTLCDRGQRRLQQWPQRPQWARWPRWHTTASPGTALDQRPDQLALQRRRICFPLRRPQQ